MPAHQADSLWDKIYLLNIAKRSFLPGVRNGEKTLLITKARSAEQSVIWSLQIYSSTEKQ
ncbi:uncharacterized protein isoform X4 [Leptinotarsa decemlineata]|uniref:uncharacterized protein isoform X4 n=1 Tax=Leptinotarsa decemlineata TaxID=7539 RepID=UPI003D30C72B